ncbi:MAG TPA: hypothetical protein VEZ72_11020, partial [Paenibacillus sp.]|nr:hypothetical protein [Paenibacillus sp.]
ALAANAAAASEADAAAATDDEGKGRTIDATTPDDDSEDEAALDFMPLAPPKFAKTESPIDPELLAQALRHMSEK